MIGLNYLGKMGQLGNQMFQYAALKGIAHNRGLEYTVPNHKEVLEDGLGNKLRIELYDAFDIYLRIEDYYLQMSMCKFITFSF